MNKQAKQQEAFLNFIEEFLRTTQRYELYRYLVSIIVAGQRSEVWKMLLEVARRERDQSKVEILLSALTLIQNDPMVADVIRNIRP